MARARAWAAVFSALILAACSSSSTGSTSGGTGTDGGSGGSDGGSGGSDGGTGGGGADGGSGGGGGGGQADGGSPDGGTAATPGSTQWVATIAGPGDDAMNGLAGSPDGTAVAFGYDTGAVAMTLRKYDGSSGAQVQRNDYPLRVDWAEGVAVSGTGDIFLKVFDATLPAPRLDLGGGPIPGPSVVELTSAARFVRIVASTCIDSCEVRDFAVSAAGAVAVELTGLDLAVLEVFPGGSGTASFTLTDPPNPRLEGTVTYGRFTFDPQENLIVAAIANGQVTLGGKSFGAHGRSTQLLVKYTLAGTIVWAVELGGFSGSIDALGTSAAGTVVAVGFFSGSFTWGTGTVSSPNGAFLLTAESDGRPRFVVSVGPSFPDQPKLAVDPVGRAAIVLGPCNAPSLRKYDLAGHFLWSHQLPPFCLAGTVNPTNVAVLSNHDVVVGGDFQGTFDFGRGPVSSAGGNDGFVAAFAP